MIEKPTKSVFRDFKEDKEVILPEPISLSAQSTSHSSNGSSDKDNKADLKLAEYKAIQKANMFALEEAVI